MTSTHHFLTAIPPAAVFCFLRSLRVSLIQANPTSTRRLSASFAPPCFFGSHPQVPPRRGRFAISKLRPSLTGLDGTAGKSHHSSGGLFSVVPGGTWLGGANIIVTGRAVSECAGMTALWDTSPHSTKDSAEPRLGYNSSLPAEPFLTRKQNPSGFVQSAR